jgi:GT2 family glycosyltransferase
MDRPEGFKVRFAQGSDRISQRNRLVRDALDCDCDYVFFLDDDCVFGKHLLTRLLATGKDIVGGLYMQRVYPFSPVAYSHKQDGLFMPINLDEMPQEPVEVAACGTGAMLIHTDVFRALGDGPWFDYGVHTEDMLFCEAAAERGFRVWVDLHEHSRVGHITTAKVWPTMVDGEWRVGFTVSDQLNLTCPVGTDRVEAMP